MLKCRGVVVQQGRGLNFDKFMSMIDIAQMYMVFCQKKDDSEGLHKNHTGDKRENISRDQIAVRREKEERGCGKSSEWGFDYLGRESSVPPRTLLSLLLDIKRLDVTFG